jgi:hypothetical protein
VFNEEELKLLQVQVAAFQKLGRGEVPSQAILSQVGSLPDQVSPADATIQFAESVAAIISKKREEAGPIKIPEAIERAVLALKDRLVEKVRLSCSKKA